MNTVKQNDGRMSTLSSRLREERTRLGLSQVEFGRLGGVGKHAQINYEAGRRTPDASYLTAVAEIGVDVLYVLTGVRADPSPPPAEREPLKFLLSGQVVAEEYRRAGISLPHAVLTKETDWAYNELMARLTNPEDGDEIDAVLPQVRHLLKKHLLKADDGGTGNAADKEVTE